VNLLAPMILCKKYLSHSTNQKKHIINISSVMSQIVATSSIDYIASKWGLFGFHECLRYGKLT